MSVSHLSRCRSNHVGSVSLRKPNTALTITCLSQVKKLCIVQIQSLRPARSQPHSGPGRALEPVLRAMRPNCLFRRKTYTQKVLAQLPASSGCTYGRLFVFWAESSPGDCKSSLGHGLQKPVLDSHTSHQSFTVTHGVYSVALGIEGFTKDMEDTVL